MLLVETSSMGIVCLALNLESLNRGHGRPRLFRDLNISRGLQGDLGDPEGPMAFEQDLADLDDSGDSEEDFKNLEDPRDLGSGFNGVDNKQWIDVETGSSNVLDEEVSNLLLGSRPSWSRNTGCVSLLRTRSGGGSDEGAAGTLSNKSKHECPRRTRKSGHHLGRNSVMQRPSLDFDKMQRTCFGHRLTENGVRRPRLVSIRSLGRLSSVFSQRHCVHQSTSCVTLDPSAFTFRSLSLRHGLTMATPTDRPSRAF